jgi:hypothetical protein
MGISYAQDEVTLITICPLRAIGAHLGALGTEFILPLRSGALRTLTATVPQVCRLHCPKTVYIGIDWSQAQHDVCFL